MPVGDPVQPTTTPRRQVRVVAPVQIPNRFETVIDAGGMDSADGTPIIDPDTEITDSDRHHFLVADMGTTLRVRLAYDRATSSVTTDPIIQVFGRFDANEQWQRLVNKAGSWLATMTLTVASDSDDGSAFQYTDVHPDNHSFDLDGCQVILIGVNVILATNGNDALAFLQAKVI